MERGSGGLWHVLVLLGVPALTILAAVLGTTRLLARRALFPVSLPQPGAPFRLANGSGTVVQAHHPGFAAVTDPANTSVSVLASGFAWAEGPVWVPASHSRLSGAPFLLLSDVKRNAIYRWSELGGLEEFLYPSGNDNVTAARAWIEPGSNGLVLDPTKPQVFVMEHGNRQVSVLDLLTREKQPLVSHYQGKRFNSPNDGAFRPGTRELYFTDPPYGFKQGQAAALEDHPSKELPFSGLFRVNVDRPNSTLELLVDDIPRVNGLAFYPDGKLFVASNRQGWHWFDVQPDGHLRRIKSMAAEVPSLGLGSQDGLKIDAQGRLFATGKGGVHVFDRPASDGTVRLLGSILTGQRTGNVCFDGAGNLIILADWLVLRAVLNSH